MFIENTIFLFVVRIGSSDDMMSNNGDCNGMLSEMNGKAPGAAQRNNTTVHVCWHRNTSIGMTDHLRATEVSVKLCIKHLYVHTLLLSWTTVIKQRPLICLGNQNQLSGFLLRKFKNSNGWQKLWVVFTNFCLFFYKSFQDDSPLASLPLLGYSVSRPNEKDSIQKDFVFKLQFKNHIYFFRAESEYTFGRWAEVFCLFCFMCKTIVKTCKVKWYFCRGHTFMFPIVSRWMDVLSSATQNSSRMRLFSRKDSENNYSDIMVKWKRY